MSTVIVFKPKIKATPNTENRKVTPLARRKNSAYRAREHLTPKEVERLIAALRRSAGTQGRRACEPQEATR
jgi:hypothetical protein